MGAEAKILLWWILFGGTHILGSSVPVRTLLIDKVGKQAFKGIYSLVSFATFVPLLYVYFTNKHAGDALFDNLPGAFWITQALMLLAFIVLVQGFTVPNPLSTQAEMSGVYGTGPRGIQRITRHTQNLAFFLFGLAHCFSLPFVGDWIFFGGFVVFTILSSLHQDWRTRATGSEQAKEFLQETSAVPFAAIVSGRQKLVLSEFSSIGLVVSLLLFFVVRYFHSALFGGF
jgi:uncharacterized membrane protein